MTTVTTPEAELGQPQLIFRYAHHAVGERRRTDLADGAYLGYDYDALGQLQLAHRFWIGGQLVAGQQFAYEFDHMGNRVFTQAGGDTAGAGLRLAQYVERVQIGVPGAPAREGRLWLAPNPESFTYDNDGNPTQDGRWRYTWDGENRLLKIESLPNAPAHSARSIAFTYDYRGRLIQREEAGAARTRFAYNGWQCVAELDATTNPAAPTLARSYLWGVDMAGWGGGAADGAGGVGGLIAVHSPAHGVHFCAYDGNGNVVGLVDSTGQISARYDYDPFGGPLRVSGQPIAYDHPFRFSTKRTDLTTDLVHYEYRVYSPTLGRWLSRDPLGERPHGNLYSFVANDPQGRLEKLGLEDFLLMAPPLTHTEVAALALAHKDLVAGFLSYFRGSYRMARFTFRYCGCCGDTQRTTAKLELRLTQVLMKEALSNEQLREIAWTHARRRFGNDPCRIVGKCAAGTATSFVLTSGIGPTGRVVGVSISAGAATGDALHECAKTLELIREEFPGAYDGLTDILGLYEQLPLEHRQQFIDNIIGRVLSGRSAIED